MHFAKKHSSAIVLLLVVSIFFCGKPYAHGDGPGAAQKELQQRIDFGNAHILGQSIKSGAVYLMHRKKSDIKNMIKVRQHYREEIKEDYSFKINTHSAINPSGVENDETNSAK